MASPQLVQRFATPAQCLFGLSIIHEGEGLSQSSSSSRSLSLSIHSCDSSFGTISSAMDAESRFSISCNVASAACGTPSSATKPSVAPTPSPTGSTTGAGASSSTAGGAGRTAKSLISAKNSRFFLGSPPPFSSSTGSGGAATSCSAAGAAPPFSLKSTALAMGSTCSSICFMIPPGAAPANLFRLAPSSPHDSSLGFGAFGRGTLSSTAIHLGPTCTPRRCAPGPRRAGVGLCVTNPPTVDPSASPMASRRSPRI
mmetsp:Transcript_22231/g.54783  ORF Transcript_22231/g.54783 Transcript_22231/m.54783 type:complete len:256 (+) Transcript_22231:333-1100(+)